MKTIFSICLGICAFVFASHGQTDKPVKLKGQVVCSVCWFEAPDRNKTPYGNAADIDCAKDCSEQGIAQALAVEDEKGFTLYTLKPGAFKPNGKDFLEIVPKYVEIEGELRIEKDKRFIKVNSLKVLEETPVKPVPHSNDAVLALKDLTGTEQSLAGYRGRFVVLNFWATWCGPCRKEMPDLAAIQNDYAALGVQVIGAAGDEAADGAKVLKFIRDYKVNFPVWIGATTNDMERFGLGTVLPATAIIDREGKIVWREVGIIKPAELRKKLDELLLPKVNEAAKVAKAERAKTGNVSLVPA
ncbi:MAG: TlpA family protein disulfide reductase [Pyrinomonadaceae bacterium]